MGFNPAKDVLAEDINDMYTVNVIGLFHLIQQFLTLPSTTACSDGPKSVIHISSVNSQAYQPGSAGYSSSKAAANQIVNHFAYDSPQGNVKFFNLHPGAIFSPLAKENNLDDLVAWEDGELQAAIYGPYVRGD
jgi:NADP-dependent 3-hydroxy acid dehydrogenase YdfG